MKWTEKENAILVSVQQLHRLLLNLIMYINTQQHVDTVVLNKLQETLSEANVTLSLLLNETSNYAIKDYIETEVKELLKTKDKNEALQCRMDIGNKLSDFVQSKLKDVKI